MRVTGSPLVPVALAVVGAIVISTCRSDEGSRVTTEPEIPALASVVPPGSVVFIGAGDISSCSHHNDTSTAKILDTIAGTVFVTGDNAAPYGDSTTYANCYNPTWGRQKTRTYPAPGDVEYTTAGAPGYFGYFGAVAGDPTKGYYSYNLGAWHIIVLNSQSSAAFAAGSPQEQWLKADLAANPAQCTLAYWHYPLFYSGTSTVRSWVQPIWNDLYAAHADVVLNSHTRNYERFAPQTPTAALDTVYGIRQFIVGTGGLGTWSFGTIAPNSLVRGQAYGVLKFTLSPVSYSWTFIGIPGTQFTDSGSATCHGPAGPSANPGGPYAAEGPIAFNGTASYSPQGYTPLTYTWNFGDGATGTGATPSHTYATYGAYTVSLVVTDSRGTASAPTSTTANFQNFPPGVNAGPDLRTISGRSVQVTTNFSDPGTDGPWSYTVKWGDGTNSTGSVTNQSAFRLSHTYATVGLDTVRVAMTDAGGATGSDSLAVLVEPSGTPEVVVAAGDIADCSGTGSTQTASLLDNLSGTVMTVGDNAYPSGATTDYANCYGPTWGRHKYRTYATLGNHDYSLGNANASWDYFGSGAGDRGNGYYSFDLQSWHIVVLNSNYTYVPTAVGSAQELWLKTDLAAVGGKCILAVWHHPRFYSSTTSPLSAGGSTLPFWNDLYAAHADLIVNGHMHDYERFGQTDPSGNLDLANGIREIIVGTGGGGFDAPNTYFWPNSQVRISGVYGVLKLTLSAGSYTWQFVPVAGQTAADSGTTTCHNAGSGTTTPTAPTAVAGGPYSGNEGTAVTFNGSGSTDPQGSALTYAWSFGDGTTGSGATPSHVYADNGSYTVSLTVTDALNLSSTAAPTVATIANVAPSVTAPTSLAATAGTAVTFSATFSDPGINDAPWTYSINWGDGSTATTGSVTSQSVAITASHTYTAGGTDTVRVTVTDKDSGAGSAKTPVTVTVAPSPPTAAPGGPYTGSEGSAVTFNGSGSTDPQGSTLTYAWSFGDGTTGTGVSPTHVYADNGSYTVSLTVTDALNLSSTAATTTATIANVAPTVSAPASLAATAGTAVTFSTTFSDPGVNDAPWTYSINWGDGSAATTGSVSSQSTAITASHTYPASGTDTVRVTVTDKDNGTGSGRTIVTVAAQSRPPTASAGGPYTGNEGSAVTVNGSGSSDPQGSALTYAWNFGDGMTGTGATPSHVYADNGSYTVSLTVTDALGLASSAATTTATIANVAPTVSAPANLVANVGSPITLSATFSDPGTKDAPWSYSINWGDGSAATTGSLTAQTGISAAHTYAAAGSNTAIVTVTDKDGGAGSAQTLVTVSQQVASVTLVGAGNIARCDRTYDEATAALLDGITGTVFALGDGAYPGGTPSAYSNCYDPTWGRHKARTYPVIGHHDYDSSTTAAGYYGYWGAQAGDPTKGYYSFDLGAWHIVVLNSNATYVSTAVGSPQETWLKADLAASTKKCQLALFHAPRFYSTTSAQFYPTSSVKPFWDDLYAAGAELIINAHMRDYERFAPQNSAGVADPNGIREIIVGTGGEGLDSPNTLIIPNSQVQISQVYGVLKLTLADGSYSWQFIPVAGQTASDSGSGTCH